MSHLGAFAQHKVAVGAVAFDARIVGVWEGNVAKALGGYRQRIEFLNDCLHANITVMGQTLSAIFRMDASKTPGNLDIEVLPSYSLHLQVPGWLPASLRPWHVQPEAAAGLRRPRPLHHGARPKVRGATSRAPAARLCPRAGT